MKKLLALIVVLVVALSFTACNLLGGPGKGGEDDDDGTGAKASVFFEMIASGTYHIKYKMLAEETESEIDLEAEIEQFVKDDMTAVIMDIGGMTIRSITRDGKVYSIFDDMEMMMVSDATEDSTSDENPFSGFGGLSGSIPSSIGTDEFNGEMLTYAEYKEDDASIFIFLRGNTLVGMRIVSGSTKIDMIILLLDQNIPDSVFDIPDYTEIGA